VEGKAVKNLWQLKRITKEPKRKTETELKGTERKTERTEAVLVTKNTFSGKLWKDKY